MFIFGVRNINIKGYTMINIREPESMYKRFNVYQILLAYRDNTKFKQKLVVIVMERDTEKYIYLKICELNKSRMCVQYVTSREPAQQACDHMLIIDNFFDSILCIVMFPSDVIKVFVCEVMPSNI